MTRILGLQWLSIEEALINHCACNAVTVVQLQNMYQAGL